MCSAFLYARATEKDLPDRQAAIEWIIKNQLVRSELALKLKKSIEAREREIQRTSTGGTNPQLVQKSAEAVKNRDELAKLAGVSYDTSCIL